ncbi:MAG TPA: methyltransferase [Pyrinomonadaceae bacterium]|jgi:hypothetical protein|nr:methyltransferase [Pyrinomonadaceae bacterium]
MIPALSAQPTGSWPPAGPAGSVQGSVLHSTDLVESMARLINSHRITGVLCAAARLGLADLIGSTAISVAELASATGCQPNALYRLLRAVASLGVFEETGDAEFRNTEASLLLRRDAEPSLYGLACMTSRMHLYAWPQLLHSLQTGQSAFNKVFGSEIFEYMAEQPEASEAFDQAMAGYTEVVADAVLDAYDFSPFEHVIDIGGGAGALLKKVLTRYPNVRGSIYDLKHVVTRSLESIKDTVWADRLFGLPGNFLEAAPPGGDLYVIKIVLCDWQDDDARRILANVRKVISKGKRLLIVDAILPPGNTPSFAKLSDINMMVITGGKERTAEDFRQLLAATGFDVVSVNPIHEWVGLIDAVPCD